MSRDKYISLREIGTSLVQNETEIVNEIRIKILMIQINIGKFEIWVTIKNDLLPMNSDLNH